jgi:quercetin dioxygenase-like cupin family protein
MIMTEPITLFPKKETRHKILKLEAIMKKRGCEEGDQHDCPLKHTYASGIYVREIFIPKGKLIVGKIHRYEHPNFLMSGKVVVVTEEGGTETIEAPKSMISPAGTKRVVMALEDTVWITVHLNPKDSTDPKEIEEDVIVKSYEQYELEQKNMEVITCHSEL